MAKKCAECGEKLKLTNRRWQYINGVFTEFCSDEHRAAYERRPVRETQLKTQPPKGAIRRWFQASAIGRWYDGRLNLEYTFWITFVSIPLLMGAVTYFTFALLEDGPLGRTNGPISPLAFLTIFVVSVILFYGLFAAVAVVRCARRYEHPTFWSRTASILAWVYAVGPGVIAALAFALYVVYFIAFFASN